MYYTGTDLHSDNCVMKTLTEDGHHSKSSCLANNSKSIIDYFKSIEPNLSEHKVVVETTHNYYWFTDLLKQNGIDVTLAHAYSLRAITASKVKTD
jgi:transposase